DGPGPGTSVARITPLSRRTSASHPPSSDRMGVSAAARHRLGSGRAQQVIPVADARVEDSFAEGFEPIDVLDGLNGGDRSGVGLAEALGPLTKQKLLLARDAAFPQNGLIGRRFSHGLN